nr:hypothetical protein BaRGS_034431 [Batillaria attramentaria]
MLVILRRDVVNGSPAVFKSDLCVDDGTIMRCDYRQVINIRQIACGDGSRACAPEMNQTIFRLCEGRRSCAGLGLRNIMGVHCLSPVTSTRHVNIEFTCRPEPDNPAPPCRTNICSNTSLGMTCPDNSVLHVRHLACLSDLGPCPWDAYSMLYTLCEGRQECGSSGLRMLMPSYCDHPVSHLRNVYVEYLCVPKKLTWSKCNGQLTTLAEPFGLLMSPGAAARSLTSSVQCNWILAPSSDTQQNLLDRRSQI